MAPNYPALVQQPVSQPPESEWAYFIDQFPATLQIYCANLKSDKLSRGPFSFGDDWLLGLLADKLTFKLNYIGNFCAAAVRRDNPEI